MDETPLCRNCTVQPHPLDAHAPGTMVRPCRATIIVKDERPEATTYGATFQFPCPCADYQPVLKAVRTKAAKRAS